ncbi:MAG: glycosyltransferase family 4 protein [bacterium]
MADKIRVLHLIAKWGRSNDLINEYIRSLDQDRFESILCSMDAGPGDGFKPEGYLLHSLGYSRENLHGFHPRVAWELKRLLVEQDIQILHCHKHRSVLYGTMAAVMSRKKDLKVIATVHSLRRSRTLNRRLTNRFFFPRISRIIAVSEAVRQDVLLANRYLDPEKIVVIHNGINLDRFPLRTGTEQRETWPVLGTVGRLVHTKGQIYLLRAFAEVIKVFPHALLLFAGTGPLLKDLEQETEKLSIVSRVRFQGFQEDVPKFLNGLDLFIFPSLAEGLALSVLEAMATGIPVIASKVGGIPEILQGQPCGRLVEPRDVAGLAQAIVDLLSKGEQRLIEMGRPGRKRVEETFSLRRMANDTERLYLQVTGS